MKYYKILDQNQNGNIDRLLSSSDILYNENAVEITEEEYRLYVPENIELDKQNEIE